MKLSASTRRREFRLGPALLASTALRLGLHVDQRQAVLPASSETVAGTVKARPGENEHDQERAC